MLNIDNKISLLPIWRYTSKPLCYFLGCLHDPANVQQAFSRCIQNTRANAGRLLEVCWTFALSCKHFITFV